MNRRLVVGTSVVFFALILLLALGKSPFGAQAEVIEPSGGLTETATETVLATETETSTVVPTETATESATTEATGTFTATPTETGSPSPTSTSTLPPTPTATATPSQTGTETPTSTASATATITPSPTPDIKDVQVVISCRTNPETIKITNLLPGSVLIQSIRTIASPVAAEPFNVNRTISASASFTWKAGSAATTNVLTTSEIFTDWRYQEDGVVVTTSIGKIVVRCPERVGPTPPSLMQITLSCNTNPEKTTLKNVGLEPIYLTNLRTNWDKRSDEPFSLGGRRLVPGESITYQSGSSAGAANRITTRDIYTEFAGVVEGVTIKISTTKMFSKSCPPGPKWIEVNLSTQRLNAWEGHKLIMTSLVSTGKDGFNTPTGWFTVDAKYTSKTMAACLGGECWSVPNVPWAMRITDGGVYIHGAYWHNLFGIARLSHGCINLPVWFAENLYWWAPMGTTVKVHY